MTVLPSCEPRPLSIAPAAPQPQRELSALEEHLQRIHVLRPGLHVHADDAADAQDFVATGQIEQGLRIIVLLEGAVNLRYGASRVQLSSAMADRARVGHGGHAPRAMLVSIAETDRFERHARRGTYARRLSVGVGAHWLDQVMAGQPERAVEDFMRCHLAMRHWQPSHRIVALAEQIVRAPALSAPFLHLYLESRVLELVSEGLSQLGQDAGSAGHAAQAARLLPHEHRRVRALHDFLQTERACEMSLDGLARQAGVNPNTLQKHFRAVYGTTIFDFLREQRLQRARVALERDGQPVAQAALLAGYTSAANFATAYRKRFGMQPKLARGRV